MPPPQPLLLTLTPLSQSTFHPFGSVLSNPNPHLTPSSAPPPAGAISANQGSALKYPDITPLTDLYASAPSGQPSRATISMFVCAPRPLVPSASAGGAPTFPVEILERHPFTTQSFIPLGLSASSPSTRYLVIVAPNLPPSAGGLASADPDARVPGKNLPDLGRMQAFIARGDQGVTYAPGTWHAPMVVLGETVGFVVAQFVNAVGEEDCQEVVWNGQGGEAVVRVRVPMVGGDSRL
ncbi:hypothetical protein V498_04607 [Pseudogymnoascus sp. VKM F-4517 (FW-2822)]|nr:hypothetical protein V498_04607 [Pseudogymnoascus sp. VKM F-4517 (FW-2822)]